MTREGVASSTLEAVSVDPLLADALSLDPVVVAVVVAMAAVTVLAKVGGIWLIRHVELTDRLEAALTVLPGAIVIAVLGPELAAAGPAEWGAAALVALVVWRTESILLGLVTGVVAVVLLRSLL